MKSYDESGVNDQKVPVYLPILGRFMPPDPIGWGDGINVYQYDHSDPVTGGSALWASLI